MCRIPAVLFACFVLTLAGCGGGGGSANKPRETAAPREPVPDVYRVNFDTSKGLFAVEVTKAWAPLGAERFYRLIETKFYDDARFFRVIRDFIVQFGINGDPKVEELWRNLTIQDDPVKETNARGTITFATAGPGTRTTQVFLNLKDNARLDESGFAPFGKVVEGMDVVDHLYYAYGEGAPRGNGPDQNIIEMQGNAYLEAKFPRLDYIKTARIAK